MSTWCDDAHFTNPETHESLRCTEMMPNGETHELLEALKTAMREDPIRRVLNTFDPTKPINKMKYLVDLYEHPNKPEDRETALSFLQSMIEDNSKNPEVMELAWYLALTRYRVESNPLFLMSAAHQVRALQGVKMNKKSDEVGLIEDFYGGIFRELNSENSAISEILPRIIQILGKHFLSWLSREVQTRNDMKWDRWKNLLRRLKYYSSRTSNWL